MYLVGDCENSRKQRALEILNGRTLQLEPGNNYDTRSPLHPRAPIECLRASPDGKLVAIKTNNRITLISSAELKTENSNGFQGKKYPCIDIGPNSRIALSNTLLAVCSRYWLSMFQVSGQSYKLLKKFNLGEKREPRDLKFSNDGACLGLVFDDGTFNVFSTKHYQKISPQNDNDDDDDDDDDDICQAIAFSPDNPKRFATASNGSVKIYDIDSSKSFSAIQTISYPSPWSEEKKCIQTFDWVEELLMVIGIQSDRPDLKITTLNPKTSTYKQHPLTDPQHHAGVIALHKEGDQRFLLVASSSGIYKLKLPTT
ncbi:hypothetical protein EBU95_09010 [bacterium]|nr:hypothetical protein [bacterium]